jgi:transcriptional regulator
VHFFGFVSLLDDNETLDTVEEVVHKHEPELLIKRYLITDEYRDKLLPGIMGFKIQSSKIEGKLKFNQQRNKEDQIGVFNALSNFSDLNNIALANHMKTLNLGIGS